MPHVKETEVTSEVRDTMMNWIWSLPTPEPKAEAEQSDKD